MHYIIIEAIISIYAILILGEKLLQALSAPIWAAVFLGGYHIIIGHYNVSVCPLGFKMDAKLGKEVVNRLALEHISDKERPLLKLIAPMLKESDNSAGL
jgi:hypothetical protein